MPRAITRLNQRLHATTLLEVNARKGIRVTGNVRRINVSTDKNLASAT